MRCEEVKKITKMIDQRLYDLAEEEMAATEIDNGL